jgi:7,8-dihydropterin-6-yl-methyl-4-(beta-D-ribofuranosyl)aminobenzene 5'-phosphate synthase
MDRESHVSSLNRRPFLQTTAALGGALVSARVGRSAQAATPRIDAPVVDRVVIREITDNSHNIFLGPLERPGLTVQRTGFPAAAEGKTLESEWGLALHIETTRGVESRRYLLDFGFTPSVYTNNLDLLKSTRR